LLAPSGRVLCVDFEHFPDGPDVVLLDPQAPAGSNVQFVPNPPSGHRLLCAGHCSLADGSVLFSGGFQFPNEFLTTIYVPDAAGGVGTWLTGPDEEWAIAGFPGTPATWRFYPTTITLASGDVLVLDGKNGCPLDEQASFGNANVPVIFHPTSAAPYGTWSPLYPGEYTPDPAGLCGTNCTSGPWQFGLGYYPTAFQAGDGSVFVAGQSDSRDCSTSPDPPFDTHKLLAGLQAWQTTEASSFLGQSAVMYRTNTVMKAGGSSANVGEHFAASIDLGAAQPHWTALSPMIHARTHFYLVALPDGNVISVGGIDEQDHGVLPAEVFDPYSNPPSGTWTEMAPMLRRRHYHSAVVLLPDGQVFAAGG